MGYNKPSYWYDTDTFCCRFIHTDTDQFLNRWVFLHFCPTIAQISSSNFCWRHVCSVWTKTSMFCRIHGGWLILRESSLTHWSLSPVRCPPWPRSQPCRCSPPVFSESVRPPLGSPPDGPCSRSYHLQTHTVQHTSAHTHLNMTPSKQQCVCVCVCVPVNMAQK